MKFLQRCMVLMLLAAWLVPVQCSLADLSPEYAALNKARTGEWEARLGDYLRWNYYQRALYAQIYGMRAGDYFNDRWRQSLPKFPTEDVLTYEQALALAKDFLCDFDPRITQEYLTPMHVASCYYDYWDNPKNAVTRTAHVQMWCVQFWEIDEDGEWWVRAAAYIDAYKGQVAMIDLGLDRKSADEFLENHQIIK